MTHLVGERVAAPPSAHPRGDGAAAAVLVVFGIHTMVWGVIVATLRQRVVPGGLALARTL
ncbi:hypothetical protein ACQEVF_41700 [Nonomuraea polychroma]|uniref:hypothetical protein n=1 Tax=Nonomuraea polychroma TaxID=46176 RepID=UPI003D91FA99